MITRSRSSFAGDVGTLVCFTALIAAAVVFTTVTASGVGAQGPSSGVNGASGRAAVSMLINTDELATLSTRRDVVILQVGSSAQFEAAHIAGARPVALTDISTPRAPGTLNLELPASSVLEQWARSVGISDASRIIVVPANDTLQSSTRVYLTLAYMGFADRTSLLNGGLMAWKAAGKPVATGPASPMSASTAPLTVRRDSSIIAVITDVDAAIEDANTKVIDARTPQFYAGNGGGYPRPGHIPTAVNIPLTTVAEGGLFKSEAELRALFDGAGVKPGEKVITYCHIGQQATLLWFVARQLGYDAQMFDGSFQQWSGSDRPLGTP